MAKKSVVLGWKKQMAIKVENLCCWIPILSLKGIFRDCDRPSGRSADTGLFDTFRELRETCLLDVAVCRVL